MAETLREALEVVTEMENEGVVTWGDEGHRQRFLAALAKPSVDLDVELLEFAAWIVEHGVTRGGDWACAECRPDSDMLVAGFRCVPHRAAEYTRLRDARSTPE